MKKLQDSFVSVTQYSKLNHLTRQGVIKAIKEKRLFAERIGYFWLISKEEKIKHLKERKK